MSRPDDSIARLSDEDLLTRIRSGAHDLFGELVRRYERELFGYLKRYTGNEELAADVFQNSFTQVFLKIQQYEPGRPARPWLYTIATNQAIDALRRRARRSDTRTDTFLSNDSEDAGSAKSLYELLESPDPGPEEQVAAAEQQQSVRDAVDQLPPLHREVIILAYFQGLKYQDIADTLGLPLGTVKSRLHAALARLADTWKSAESCGESPER
ncbi:MAG: sigma-70 family RNA polymerase sigma factor [Bacteroidales bacterium]|nr:sigma-70 family RNA polymerase sigma factor [Bacteroidales bacterium]